MALSFSLLVNKYFCKANKRRRWAPPPSGPGGGHRCPLPESQCGWWLGALRGQWAMGPASGRLPRGPLLHEDPRAAAPRLGSRLGWPARPCGHTAAAGRGNTLTTPCRGLWLGLQLLSVPQAAKPRSAYPRVTRPLRPRVPPPGTILWEQLAPCPRATGLCPEPVLGDAGQPQTGHGPVGFPEHSRDTALPASPSSPRYLGYRVLAAATNPAVTPKQSPGIPVPRTTLCWKNRCCQWSQRPSLPTEEGGHFHHQRAAEGRWGQLLLPRGRFPESSPQGHPSAPPLTPASGVPK